jgi:hypothetical protein
VKTKIIETSGNGNWGKFMVARFDLAERNYVSVLPEVEGTQPIARWQPSTLLVLDLATGEGALFTPGGLPEYDLNKHAIWVCPMFEAFLTWLYQQDTADLDALPAYVDLPDVPFSLVGYRRPGPDRKEAS